MKAPPQPRPAFWLEGRHYDWRALTAGRALRRLGKEAVVFHQGMPVQEVFVVVQGRVRLTTFSAEGRERHVVVVGPGGLLGDAGMGEPGRHLTSAVVSAEAALCAVPRVTLLAAMQADPAVLHQVLAFSDQRFQAMLQHHELLGTGSAIRRVGLALLGLAQGFGTPHADGLKIQMRFTQSEMASICSISRMSVSTVFGVLAGRGLLLRDGPWVVLPDVAALEAATRVSDA